MGSNKISVTKLDLIEAFKLWAEDFRINPDDYNGGSVADLDLTAYSYGAANELIDYIATVQTKYQDKGEVNV